MAHIRQKFAFCSVGPLGSVENQHLVLRQPVIQHKNNNPCHKNHGTHAQYGMLPHIPQAANSIIQDAIRHDHCQIPFGVRQMGTVKMLICLVYHGHGRIILLRLHGIIQFPCIFFCCLPVKFRKYLLNV